MPETALETLDRLLPFLGHRNWIAVVDSAYPLQSTPGITTVVADAPLLEIAQQVIAKIENASHVRSLIYLDSEIEYLDDIDAPGAGAFRNQLADLFGDRNARLLPHEEIVTKLAAAGNGFNVLIIKTTEVIPYTSVFIELDCGYWTADAESRLRERIKSLPARG